MDPVPTEREFWRTLVATVAMAGLHSIHFIDLFGRAQMQRQRGAWTDADTFVGKLKASHPVFFEGSPPQADASRPAPGPESSPLAPEPASTPVTYHQPPGTLLLSREDARDASKYREARDLAEKKGLQLLIEAPTLGDNPMCGA